MSNPRMARLAALVAVAALGASASGCATKGFVRKEIAAQDARTTPEIQKAEADAQAAQVTAQGADEKALRAQREAQLARDMALGHIKREEVRRVTVNFPFNSAEIGDDAYSALDGITADLQANPNYMALVTGYTDATGDENYNIMLAQRRAAAVQLHLATRLGPEFVRLATIGFGELNPVAENDTREGRAANRRTEVILVKPAPTGTTESETAARP